MNINNGYGALLAQGLTRRGTFGKTFFVCKSTHPNYDEIAEVFGVPEDGKPRLFSTIQSAVDACVASRGDVIKVAQGHAETISSATALLLNKAGVTLEGVGIGDLSPSLTFDTAVSATIAVSAANVRIENFNLIANYADIDAVFTLTTAKNFQVANCRIKAAAADMNFKYVFDTNATTGDANGLTFEDSSWVEPDAATVSLCKVDGINDGWKFKRNYISIATQATGGGMFVIATGKYLTNVEVEDNRARLIGGDLSGAGVVFTTDSSSNTGHFSRNYIQHTDTGSEIFGTASSGFSFFENRMSGVAGATGYVLPAVDS